MGLLSWMTGSIYTERNAVNALHHRFRHPSTHEGWVQRYGWLQSCYEGEPYTVSEIKALGLFRALNDRDEVIAETRRLTRDVSHIVDTDARAMASGIRLVNARDSAASRALEAAGNEVWKRSKMRAKLGAWARSTASMGDVGIEAVRRNATRPYDSILVGHDPRSYQCIYDDTGLELEQVIIRAPRFERVSVVNGQVVDPDRLGQYLRVIDRDKVEVWIDGAYREDLSGEHGLGAVPFVHVPFTPLLADPGYGLWSAQGLDMALAMIDSFMTQVQAVGARHGNPLLYGKGFRIGSGGNELALGRAMTGIPVGGEIGYLEATMTGLDTLLKAAQQARMDSRATCPEFLFSEAGASASGAALNFWASAFVSKMEEVNDRWFAALIQATEMALAMDAGREWEPTEDLTIQAPPVLPVETASEFRTAIDARNEGALTRGDLIRHLQRLGIVPDDADPDVYAATAKAERDAENAELAALVNQPAPPPVVDVG